MYRIVASPHPAKAFRKSVQLAALAKLLPDEAIEAVCRQVRHTWRERQFPPGVTVRSMIYRGLHPDHSIAAMLADLSALSGPEAAIPTDSAWCQARSRLPESVLTRLIGQEACRCRRLFGPQHRWHHRQVFRIDGSTVSMPDTPSLVKAFGYTDGRHGRSRFPVARVTFIELAGLDIIWDYRLDRYKCSEEAQLYDMWETLPYGCICLLDRKFCSFYNLAKLRQRRIDVITPLHQRRDPAKLIKQGRPCGKNQWLVPLELNAQSRRQYHDPSLPKVLWVRLIRVALWGGKHRWLVTTLLDTVEYPRQQIIQEYRVRWGVETRIGSLKTTLEMNVLRGKSPNAVRREVASIVLGHNLVWRRIHEAAAVTQTPAQDISFAGAVKAVLAFSAAILLAPAPASAEHLEAKLLQHIARHTNHHPFGRVEPRRVKRHTVRYPYLQEPRWKARLKCLS